MDLTLQKSSRIRRSCEEELGTIKITEGVLMDSQNTCNQIVAASNSGIAIPDNFEVKSYSAKNTQCRYLRVVSSEYDTNESQDHFREFLHLRKMAATILPICSAEQKYLMIRQFRFPAYFNAEKGIEPILNSKEEDGWLYETIAGVIEPGDTPEQTVIREAQEEGGVTIDPSNLRKVHQAYMTPGCTNEVCHVFLALVDKTHDIQQVGLVDEGELIRAKWMTAEEIRKLNDQGLIRDCKTIMALYAARIL